MVKVKDKGVIIPTSTTKFLVSESDTGEVKQSELQNMGAGIKLDDLAAPDDNTDLNVSTSAHGLAPKLPNDATRYLNGLGQWTIPSGGGGGTGLPQGYAVVDSTYPANDPLTRTYKDFEVAVSTEPENTTFVFFQDGQSFSPATSVELKVGQKFVCAFSPSSGITINIANDFTSAASASLTEVNKDGGNVFFKGFIFDISGGTEFNLYLDDSAININQKIAITTFEIYANDSFIKIQPDQTIGNLDLGDITINLDNSRFRLPTGNGNSSYYSTVNLNVNGSTHYINDTFYKDILIGVDADLSSETTQFVSSLVIDVQSGIIHDITAMADEVYLTSQGTVISATFETAGAVIDASDTGVIGNVYLYMKDLQIFPSLIATSFASIGNYGGNIKNIEIEKSDHLTLPSANSYAALVNVYGSYNSYTGITPYILGDAAFTKANFPSYSNFAVMTADVENDCVVEFFETEINSDLFDSSPAYFVFSPTFESLGMGGIKPKLIVNGASSGLIMDWGTSAFGAISEKVLVQTAAIFGTYQMPVSVVVDNLGIIQSGGGDGLPRTIYIYKNTVPTRAQYVDLETKLITLGMDDAAVYICDSFDSEVKTNCIDEGASNSFYISGTRSKYIFYGKNDGDFRTSSTDGKIIIEKLVQNTNANLTIFDSETSVRDCIINNLTVEEGADNCIGYGNVITGTYTNVDGVNNKFLDYTNVGGEVNPAATLLDEDDFASNSNTQAPTQQSTKAYVDNNEGRIQQTTVINNTGVTISKGKVVSGSGFSGGFPEVVLADASVFEKSRMIGVATEDILDGETGIIYTFGQITGLDTSSLSVGPVYLTTEGNLSSTQPTNEFFYAIIGFVGVSDAVNGILFVNVINLELTAEVTSTNGFPENQRAGTTLTYTDLTRTIEIAPTGARFHFYQSGVKYIKTAPDSYVLPDLEGPHLVYYDNGSLTSLHNPTEAQAIDVIKTKCLVTDCYWDSTNQEFIYKGDARHGISMSPATHAYLHSTQGTKYVGGLDVLNTDSTGDGSLDAHAQFGIDAGSIIDEDLLTNISAVASTTGLPIYYYEGALGFLRRQFNSGFSLLTAGTGRLAWNEDTGATYQLAECANNTFVCYHVFASGGVEYPLTAFVGLVNYPSLAEAQEGAKTEIFDVRDKTVSSEVAPIATFIFQTENSFTNAVKAKLVEAETGSDFIDFRTATAQGGGAGSPNHNTLPGLDLAGAGVNFGHIDDNGQTIAGTKTFLNFPITPSAEPTADYEVINKKYFEDWNGLSVRIPVYNKTGVTITRGKVCYANGYFNDLSTVDLADATIYEKSRYLVVATEDILNDQIGRVMAFGKLTNIDTSSYGVTGPLYLTTNGDMSTTRPTGGSFIGHVGNVSVVDAVNGVIYVDPQVAYDTVEETDTNGFPPSQRFEAVLSYDNPTRTVTVTPAGSQYHYYQDGVKYIQTGPQSITVGPAEEGPHAIYFDGATLTDFYNPTPQQYNELIRTKCLVTGVNFDTTNQVFNYLADHRYGISMSPATHVYLSSTKGTQYTGGLDLNNFVIGDGSLNTHAQFGHEAGTTINKDIQYDIDAVLSTVGAPIYHFETALGLLRRDINAGFSVRTTGSGRLAFNENVGGAWQVSECANNSYVLCHIAATASVEYPLNAFMGLENYLTLNDAKNAAKTEIFSVEVMLTRTEVIPLATVIFQTSDSYTNSVKAKIIEVDTGIYYQDFKVEADVGTVESHNGLLDVNLANTGITYGHIDDQAQTIYGVKTFNSFALTPSLAPTTNYQTANKKYVDDKVGIFQTIVADRNEPNGFVDPDNEVNCTFDDGLRRLTIQPAVTNFNYYTDGTKYTKTGAETIDIANTEGLHYVYYNGVTLAETTTFDDRLITEWAFVAAIYWDVTNSKQIYFAREFKHSIIMDSATHRYLHNSRGFQLVSGGLLGSILTDQDGSLNTHCQFAVEESTCYDEDARHTIAARTASSNIPLYYRDGAEASNIWRIDETNSFPVLAAGTGRAAYNQLSGGFWSTTEVTNGNYVLAHVAVNNDSDRGFVAFMGENEYSNVTDARNGALTEIKDIVINGLPGLEFKFIGTLIIQTSDSYTNTPKSRFISTGDGSDYVDFRGTQLAANKGSSEITDHNALANLQGGTVSEYNHLTNAQVAEIAANTAAKHDAVTVTDTATVDLTLTGQEIQAAVIQSGIDHESVGGLLGGAASDHYHITGAQNTKVAAVTGDIVGTTDTQTLTNKTIAYGSNTLSGLPVELGIACSNETTAITAGVLKSTFRMPFAMTLTAVRASVSTAPTGASIIIDINESGTTILSTKLSIAAGSKTSVGGTPPVISDPNLADNAEITVDFDQVGTTLAGAGVKIWLIGTRV